METSEFDVQTANGGGAVVVTDADLNEVKAYYTDGVEEDGWTSDGSLDLDEDSALATVHQGDQVAFAYLIRGAAAKGGALEAATTGMEIDQSKIDDTDTVIALSYFTCEEDDIQACVAAFANLGQ